MPNLKVRQPPRSTAHAHVAKAKQFSIASRQALDTGQADAALLLAIHAGISAADAVCIALSGRRSAESDHLRAADLLEEVARGSDEIRAKVSQLRALLKMKNTVEYEDRRVSLREAKDGVERSERFVTWAASEVVKARV